MNRVLIIDSCSDCPFFDNEYYNYSRECIKLDRKIEGEDEKYPIHEDCPLKKTSEEITK